MDDQRLRKKPKILLTNFSADERKTLSEQIRHLGGILYESSNFIPSSTHIICKLPSRSEKFICACASGKWILPASYVEESYRQNKWLDEELFEWSAKDAEENPASQYLYSLPRKWREKYKSHRGAFRKWIVVLVFKSQKKKDGFKRLIEAGEGRVLNLRPPYRGCDIKMIKYVICEDTRSKDLFNFKRACIPILNSEEIINYIVKGQKPKVITQSFISNKNTVSSPKNQIKSKVHGREDHIKQENGFKKESNRKAKTQTSLKAFFIGLNKECFTPIEQLPINTKQANGCSLTKEEIKPILSTIKSELKGNECRSVAVSSPKDKTSLQNCISSCKKDIPKNRNTSMELQCLFSKGRSNHEPVFTKTTTGNVAVTQIMHSSALISDEDNTNVERGKSSKENQIVKQESRDPILTNSQTETLSAESKNEYTSKEDCEPFESPQTTNKYKKDDHSTRQEATSSNEKVNKDETKATPGKNSRKRQLHEVEGDLSLWFGNSPAKTRSLRSNKNSNKNDKNCGVTGSPLKRQRTSPEDVVHQATKFDHAGCLDPLAMSDMSQNLKRAPIHRYGTDLIESCIEESLFVTAVKMMASYLSPTSYLSSEMISVLMKLLKPASDDFDWSLTFFIRSILNRCILLHPPHMLPDVYIEAFKLSAAKLVDVSESDNPFDYIMSIFGESYQILKEDDDDNKKQAILSLANFTTGVLEADSNCHWNLFESGNLSASSCRKSIFSELLSYKDHRGPNMKKLLRFAVEVAITSVDSQELVPLRRLVFSLVRLLGQNCQMQDVLQLSTNYGSSCIHLTSELYQIVNSMISGNGEKGKVLSIIFGTLKLDWLAARLADLFICTYDISSIRGTARQLLRKPLSLEKIVSCYFHMIPVLPEEINNNNYRSNKKGSCKPLTVIGNKNTESARLNAKTVNKMKIPSLKRNVKGETQLHIACIRNKPMDVKQLLLLGFDPNIKDNAGWTPLHEASNHGHHLCVAELLNCKDLDIFATGMNGYTALHDAVANGHVEVVRLLAKSGGCALLDMKTTTDATAYDLAETATMKNLLLDIGDDLLNDDKTLRSYSSSVKVDDVNQFLSLLIIVLRHFIRPQELDDKINLSSKADNLRTHVAQLLSKQSNKSTSLLNIVDKMLS